MTDFTRIQTFSYVARDPSPARVAVVSSSPTPNPVRLACRQLCRQLYRQLYRHLYRQLCKQLCKQLCRQLCKQLCRLERRPRSGGPDEHWQCSSRQRTAHGRLWCVPAKPAAAP